MVQPGVVTFEQAAQHPGQVRVEHPAGLSVYRRGYRQHLERLADYLRNFHGLTPIGRYGTFRYNNQDHSILMGILAAEDLLDNQSHDLWSVNTDHDTYQEDELIT